MNTLKNNDSVLNEVLRNAIKHRFEVKMKNKEFTSVLVNRVKASFHALMKNINSEKGESILQFKSSSELKYIKLNKILAANLINLLQLQFDLCDQDENKFNEKIHDGVLINYSIEETLLDHAEYLSSSYEDVPFVSYSRMFLKEDEFQNFEKIYQSAISNFENMIKSIEESLSLNGQINESCFNKNWEDLINFILDFFSISLCVSHKISNIKIRENMKIYLYSLDCIILELLEIAQHSNFVLENRKKELKNIESQTISSMNKTKLFNLSCFV